jgi:hypothetical protein
MAFRLKSASLKATRKKTKGRVNRLALYLLLLPLFPASGDRFGFPASCVRGGHQMLEFTPSALFFLVILVAGAGFEPTTFGL